MKRKTASTHYNPFSLVISFTCGRFCILGDVLIQLSENQRRLTLELEGVVSQTDNHPADYQSAFNLCGSVSHVFTKILCVSLQFRWFSVEVLQEMDNNIRLDQDYISVNEG